MGFGFACRGQKKINYVVSSTKKLGGKPQSVREKKTEKAIF